MKKHSWIMYLVGAILLGALVWLVHTRVHFQWSVFRDELQHVDWRRIVFGIAMVVFCYWLRAARWAVLIRPQKKVVHVLLAGLAGDRLHCGRPLRPPGGPGASLSRCQANQAAVEFADCGLHRGTHVRSRCDGTSFPGALLLAPDRATLPHHEALQHAALGGLVGTMALAIFAVSRACVGQSGRRPRGKDPRLGFAIARRIAVATKIRAFRDGLDSIATLGDFFRSLALSLVMWGLITAAYLETTRAFVLSPELSSMTLARCMVLMAASMVGSVVQLPVIGWFTQIGVTTGVMQRVFHVQFEPALACGTMLLIVTFMCVIPVGLIWARIEHVSLKKISEQSEQFVRTTPSKPPRSAKLSAEHCDTVIEKAHLDSRRWLWHIPLCYP